MPQKRRRSSRTKQESKKKKLSQKLPLILMVLGVLLLVSVFAFGIYAKMSQSQAIGTYEKTVSKDVSYTDEQIKKASAYNDQIVSLYNGQSTVQATNSLKEYSSIFPKNNGIIGVLMVKKIGLKLPIYHGTSDEVLMQGVGHVEDTAFPLDTTGSKSVLTGHNGVPGADMLFTRLDELKKGDEFVVRIGDYYYKYNVRDTEVLTPEETEHYAQLPNQITDKSEVTLVTCTPYGINTHRLLIKGEFKYKSKVVDDSGVEDFSFSMGKETIVILTLLTIGCGSLIAIYIHHQMTKNK